MTGPSIFRQEALDHHARRREPGGLVQVSPRWLGPAFWVLLALVVAGLVAGAYVRVDSQSLLELMAKTLS